MDLVVDELRVRGPGAVRLARVAATTLPAALERALGGLPSGKVGSLAVTLDCDPEGLDDAALAIVWADAIRVQLAVLLPPAREAAPDVGARGQAELAEPRVSLAAAAGAARAWLAGGGDSPVPWAALQLGPLLEDAVVVHGGFTRELAELVARFADRLRPRVAIGRTSDVATPAIDGPAAQHEATTVPVETTIAEPPALAQPAREGQWRANPAAASGKDAAPQSDTAREALDRVVAVAGLLGSEPRPASTLDLASLTSAAGLALLYPWLADLCRTAVDLHPGRDAASVRALALALLVDPERPGLVADPLITLLAGETDHEHPAALAREAEVREAAELVLTSFAALVPGFGSSSPAFVRREWVQRIGVVDLEADPVQLTAHSHPLDVVLTQLPYPLGLFRLPWSPPVMARFRP